MITFKEYIENLDEALTKQQRMKRSRMMKRLGKRIAIARKRKMKRKAAPADLLKRAKKLARKRLANKILKGKDLSKLSIADRERLEKKLKGKSKTIARIAKKMLPKVKQTEKERIKKARQKGGGDRES